MVTKFEEYSDIRPDIVVTIEIAGLKYGGNFYIDADPKEIGRLVTETIERAPKKVKWVFDEYPPDPGYHE